MIRISINFFDYMKARIISACCLVALVLIEMIEPSSWNVRLWDQRFFCLRVP